MKVLIISSSPRKGGNSDTLCDEFMRGATDAGHDVEKVLLKEKKINYCIGCNMCLRPNASGVCSQKDDMVGMKETMLGADVIVFATPIYFYTISGQLKTLIDRCCFFQKELKDKDFYYIMACIGDDKGAASRALVEFDGFVSRLKGIAQKGSIVGTSTFEKGDVRATAAMGQAYEMGKNIG